MAEFLTTKGNAHQIEKIIINAVRNLTIVTPYLKLPKDIVERLSDAIKRGVAIELIFGKKQLEKEQRIILKAIGPIQLFFCKNLHAKCYHNEKSLVVSSMNLHEFSERNNREMGILIEQNSDPQIFSEVLQEIQSIKNISVPVALEKKSKKRAFKIDPKYNKINNFHLPFVYELLKRKYPYARITLDEKIVFSDFPITGYTLEVDNNVDFLIPENDFEKLKNRFNQIFIKEQPNYRFYWNNNSLNIYLEKDFKKVLNVKCMKTIAERMIEVIDLVATKFSKQ